MALGKMELGKLSCNPVWYSLRNLFLLLEGLGYSFHVYNHWGFFLLSIIGQDWESKI